MLLLGLHTGFSGDRYGGWYPYLFKNFPQFVVIHVVKGFSIVTEAEVDVFLEFSCFFCDPADVGSFISDSSAFSKSTLYIWKFLDHILLIPTLKDFEHYFASMWSEYNSAVVWSLSVIPLWDWNENWLFPVYGHYRVFQICWHIVCSTLIVSSFRICNSSAGILS